MQSDPACQDYLWEEIINGEVVPMRNYMINHSIISTNVYMVFAPYLDDKPIVPIHGGAVFFSDMEQYIPDMMVVCDPDKIRIDGVHGAPDLVAEVLSPSTGRNDKTHKKDVYEQFGVREYWIVSPGERSVEQYILTDGRYELRDIYYQYPDWMLKNMKETERAAVAREFKCSLFDDLLIPVDDIFQGMIPA